MADPFGVLWAPVTPADPDPGFAARLRARLERALDLPEGVVVSERPPHPAPVAATRRRGVREPAADESGPRARSVRRPRQGDIGYASLWVPDVHRAAEFRQLARGTEHDPGGDPRAGRPGGQERVVGDHRSAADDHRIDPAPQRVNRRPRLLAADPLRIPGPGGELAVERHGPLGVDVRAAGGQASDPVPGRTA